jgi:hypothetical protein
MPYGFAGYYVSGPGARKMLSHCQRIEGPIDWLPPLLRSRNLLDSRAVTEVVVEHHAFRGGKEVLHERTEIESRPYKLQKTASTIWKSPRVANCPALHGFISMLENARELHQSGYTVLKGVFSNEMITDARRLVLANRGLFRNTRPTHSAGHLAGVHRYPALEPLHTMLTGSSASQDLLKGALRGRGIRSIGLSDITINRSQHWHKDLLRGDYQVYLGESLDWEISGNELYKVLLYLQPGKSLRVIDGSHLEPVPLEEDRVVEPRDDDRVTSVPVEAGDVVVMDIRCSHCGADEAVYAGGEWDENPRILVSTVLGAIDGDLTRAMEEGNFHRLMDWMDRPPQDAHG